MQLPSDVKKSLDRFKVTAVLDELRGITEELQREGHQEAAALVANRADQLSATSKELSHA